MFKEIEFDPKYRRIIIRSPREPLDLVESALSLKTERLVICHLDTLPDTSREIVRCSIYLDKKDDIRKVVDSVGENPFYILPSEREIRKMEGEWV